MPTPTSSNQKIQEEQYQFPYHYIPQAQNNQFQQTYNFSWGFEYLSYVNFILDFLKSQSANSLLDIGCGDGRFLHEVKKQLKISKITGVDYSQKAIDLAKVINPDIEFIAGDIKEKNILKNTYEVITLIETLEHIPPEEATLFLNGIRQHISSNGKLLITVPADNVPVTPKHYRHFNAESLQATIKENFEIEKIIYLNRINSWRFNFIKRLLTNPLFICNFQPFRNFAYRFYLKHCLNANKQNAGRIFAVCSPKK